MTIPPAPIGSAPVGEDVDRAKYLSSAPGLLILAPGMRPDHRIGPPGAGGGRTPVLCTPCPADRLLDTLTYALPRELGPRGIRVNAIMPSYTKTPATKGDFAGELGERLLAETPLAASVSPTIARR